METESTERAPIPDDLPSLADGPITMTGIAKGDAMIGQKMGTMLGLIMTDAAITPADAQDALADAVAS